MLSGYLVSRHFISTCGDNYRITHLMFYEICDKIHGTYISVVYYSMLINHYDRLN